MKEKTEKQKEMEFNKHGLNMKQEAFCKLYTDLDKELFGNGTQCYVESYNPDISKPNWYKTAAAAASRLLTTVKVIDRINSLLEEGGFNDENVSKQHLFLLNQHADKGVKMRAVDSYYKLKGKNEATKIIISNEDNNSAEETLNKFLNEDSRNIEGRE